MTTHFSSTNPNLAPVTPPSGLLADRAPSIQWTALLILSVILGALFIWLGVPAALLLGPMVAGIIITVSGATLQIPSRTMALAQGLLGCLIAKILPMSISGEIFGHWPLFVGGVLSVIIASGLLGWLMTCMQVLPGTTLVWGLSPGAATVMTLMAEAHGADAQLVAFMQYLRVVLVAAIASVIARIYGANALHATHTITWFPAIAWLPFAETLALAIGGPIIAHFLRLRIGALLLPLFGGIFLVRSGLMTIELPHWLLAIGYALIGWRIGLRFTRPLLLHAAKALPRIALCTMMLIMLCGGLGVVLVVGAGIDPLTAYLATSPGGADSVAIIAASTKVDTSFVMAMQMVRLLAVVIIGPAFATFVAKRSRTCKIPDI